MFDKPKSYERVTLPELVEAQIRAAQYFQANGRQIADAMRVRITLLEELTERVADPDLAFDERMNTFAEIAETARDLRTDARDFFDAATAPMIVRTIRTVPPIK